MNLVPCDYNKIREDNIREYGQGTRHLSFLGRLYTDKTHFIFELLQNAEDAGASRILFKLFDDRLEVTHDGRPFNELDVRGVCGVGEGTKAEDLTQIGKFGIGFKSVYAYTSTPEVHSGDESFRIENYVRPWPVESKSAGDSWTTLFVFPFNAGIAPETACREISSRLGNLSARTLLFLRKIREINYKFSALRISYQREDIVRGHARQVSIFGQNNNRAEKWLVFERYVKVSNPPNGCPDSVPVDIAFLLETKDKVENIAKVKDSPLVVSFPTEKATLFGFLVQGPYKTTPSRDNIPKNDDWNTTLVRETAILLTEALHYLKEIGLLTVALLEALPIRMEDFSEDSMFYPIVVAVRDSLMDKELLPADDGTFVSARNAKLASAEWLRKLLRKEQVRQLFKNEVPLKWISGEITERAKHDLWKFIREELEVEEVTPDSFARKLDELFLKEQTDDWFVEFYGYLSGQESLWRAPRWDRDPATGPLRAKPILRLQDEDNIQIPPFQADGKTPNAFLPPEEETDLTIVKRTIVANEQARAFLERMGLSKPDVFDDIVRRVLPKYIRPGASLISPNQHASDIKEILRALRADSEAGKRKVIEVAKQTPFLKAINQYDMAAFQKPADIYSLTQDLKDYFSGRSDVWFLVETEGEKEWRELGVENKPRFKKINIDLTWEIKRGLIGKQGHSRDIEVTDYVLDGLENFLLRLMEENKASDRYSLILWNFLLRHLKENSHYRFYEGEYKWFYYQERSVTFDASWKKQIRSHSWLPKNGDVVPHLPSELRIVDLPDSFNRDDKLADLLGMKKDVLAILAEEAGIQAEDIEMMRQHPEEFQQWKATIAARQERPIFPMRPSQDPERRHERLAEQLTDAPEKKYEERERSVRITRGSVDPALWLRNQYTNDAGQMVCQICKEEMPFKKRDGDYYFDAVEALSKDYFPKEHEAQYLALCPLCAAMYGEFVKLDESAMQNLNDALKNSDEPEVPLNLGELETSIQFVESHWQDIKTILQEKG